MFFLIAEIILTISAWTRGWKGWALLPMILTWGISFLIGLIIGYTNPDVNPDDLVIFDIIFNVICIIALIIMISVGRKKKESPMNAPVYPVNPPAPPLNAPQPPAYPNPNYPVNSPSPPTSVIPPANIQATAGITPSTVVYRGSSLVLTDGTKIFLTEATRAVGRTDFEKAVSPNALNMISRQHLFTKYENGKYFIDDYNSANGTRVNGVEIKGKGWLELKDGDQIDVAGVTTISFKMNN